MSEMNPKTDSVQASDPLPLVEAFSSYEHGLAPLQESAREWWVAYPPTEDEVTAALVAAGIDPANEKERERFRRLVKAESQFQDAEEIARIGDYFDKALAEMERPDEKEAYRRAVLAKMAAEWAEEELRLQQEEEQD